jgi:hypothetical protein
MLLLIFTTYKLLLILSDNGIYNKISNLKKIILPETLRNSISFYRKLKNHE